jgi:hypothetical protein
MRGRLALALALSSGLGACSPALDWREARPEGSQAQLMFPCRPASHARRVALAGATVEMTMVACTAGDTVFALTFADLGDPTRVGPALDELGRALQTALRPAQGAASQVMNVPGMTPHPQAAQWRLAGRLPDGRAVQERAALFSHGTRVYQATMLGPQLDAEAQDTFFGALRVGP